MKDLISLDEPVIQHAAFSTEITGKCDAWANKAPPSGSISFPIVSPLGAAIQVRIAKGMTPLPHRRTHISRFGAASTGDSTISNESQTLLSLVVLPTFHF